MTDRHGGVSRPPWDSMNLGDHVGDAAHSVQVNRQRLQEAIGRRPVFLKQVHGHQAVALDASTQDGTEADACFALNSEVACTIMVADCLPVLFTDASGQVVAAAHAGWRGLAAGVIEHTVHAVCEAAGVVPAQVRVWLGPCIGPEAFEVGDDVRTAFTSPTAIDPLQAQRCFKAHPAHAEKWLADLAGLARVRLQALGVTSVAGNNSTTEWCTVSQPSKLFSFRRDGVTGRFAVCIWRN